jgi:hypothetical protein
MKKTLLAIALVCAALAAVSAQEGVSGLPGDQAITDYTEAVRLNPDIAWRTFGGGGE